MATHRETAALRSKIEHTTNVEALRQLALDVLDSLFPPLEPDDDSDPDEEDVRQWSSDEVEWVSHSIDSLRDALEHDDR